MRSMEVAKLVCLSLNYQGVEVLLDATHGSRPPIVTLFANNLSKTVCQKIP
jgi:hypothetical protein